MTRTAPAANAVANAPPSVPIDSSSRYPSTAETTETRTTPVHMAKTRGLAPAGLEQAARPRERFGDVGDEDADHDRDGNHALLGQRGAEDERLRNAVEHRAEHDRVRASCELLLARHALACGSTSPVDRPVADVEDERAAGESERRELDVGRDRVQHELVRDCRDERARTERHREADQRARAVAAAASAAPTHSEPAVTSPQNAASSIGRLYDSSNASCRYGDRLDTPTPTSRSAPGRSRSPRSRRPHATSPISAASSTAAGSVVERVRIVKSA